MRISLIRGKLINRSAKLLSFCMVGFGWSVLFGSTTKAEEAFDSALAKITDQIATAVNNANLKAVTVPGFTDLHDNESDLGLFLADQVSAGLVQKKCAVVDRKNVARILAEHQLTTSGLVDPENAKKLGQFAGVDAIVIGTIIPLSGTIRVTVRVLATDSARVLAASSADIPKTNSIRHLIGEPEIPEPTPMSPNIPEPTASPFSGPSGTDQAKLVIMVEQAFENHDWETLTSMTVDRMVNYFDHKHVTNGFIAQDMQNDSRTYAWQHNTPYPNTFTHEVSDQYSSHWSGPMLYDSMNVYTEAQERNGKLHKAMTRLTVGYVLDPSGRPAIYSLTLKVL
jgi:TolB-like protein